MRTERRHEEETPMQIIRETGEGGGRTPGNELQPGKQRGEGSTGTNGAKRKRGRKKGRNKFLNIMNINAQSLKHKMDELRTLVSDYKPHIIAITETWGKDSITDAAFQIEGYNMYRNDREDTNYKFGGGTLLYINKKLGQRTCKPLNCKSFESNTWCWVTPKQGKKILVGCTLLYLIVKL